MAKEVEQRLRSGERLLMGFGRRGRYWWFESPYQIVSEARLRQLEVGNVRLVESGDSLFGWPGSSQTWRLVYAAK